MPLFLNNSEIREHARFYPKDGELVPFYDLNRTGTHATQAVNLHVGTECVVATPHGARDIRFEWYSFVREAKHPAPEGVDVRVFYGTKVKEVVLPQKQAVVTEPYAVFFTPEGGFRRGSVIAHTD
jgi:hypothetical protein